MLPAVLCMQRVHSMLARMCAEATLVLASRPSYTYASTQRNPKPEPCSSGLAFCARCWHGVVQILERPLLTSEGNNEQLTAECWVGQGRAGFQKGSVLFGIGVGMGWCG